MNDVFRLPVAVEAGANGTAADSDAESIPAFEVLLTAKGQPLAIPPSQQSRMAVLLLPGTGKRVHVLVESGTASSHEFASLIAKAEHERFKVVKEQIVSITVLRSLYEGLRKPDAQILSREVNSHTRPDAERLLSELVTAAVKLRASDIHIWLWNKAGEEWGRVDFRIDGRAKKQVKFSGGYDQYKILEEIVKVAYGSLAEEGSTSDPNFLHNKDQYCSIKTALGGNINVQIRYQSFSLYYGNSYAIRVPLVEDAKVRTFKELGLSPSQEKDVSLGVRRRRGLVLTCGTTGSGKSTTNFNMVMSIPDKDSKIIYELADPVEREGKGIRQKQVQRQTEQAGKNASKYAGPIRDLLRGDPDVIIVAEMRDPDTGNAIETAVLTGHQIYTTLHVGSAFEAVTRVTSKDIGMSLEVVGGKSFLNLIIYQHLLAVLCPHCSHDHIEATKLGFLTNRLQAQIVQKFGISIEGVRFENAEGCPQCNFVGTKGRTLAAEVVLMNDELRRLIREGKFGQAEELWRLTRKAEFYEEDCTGKTALEHALYKMSIGQIDPRQIEEEFDPFELYSVIPLGGFR